MFLAILFIPFSILAQESAETIEKRINETQGEEQLRLIIELGNIYLNSDPERSLELGLKAAFLSKRIGNLQYEGQALLLMGVSSLKAEQNENAVRYYNRALSHFEKYNQLPEQILALEGMSEIYKQVRNFDLAYKYLNRALGIAKSISDVKTQIELHLKIGDIAINQRNYSQAYEEFSKVHTLFGSKEKLTKSELRQKAYSFRQIGNAYRNLGQLNESLLAYRKAVQIARELQESTQEIKDISEIAFSFFLLQQLDSSLIYYNQVLAFYQLQNDSVPMVDILLNIGDVFFEKLQYRQAVASYNRSLELAINVGDVQGQISALVNISRCFSAFGDYPSSKDYLNKALAIATRENLTNSAADVYKYLSKVHEEEGRFGQALEFYKLWSELRDSIYSEESGQKMARMQILYEITQKERENEILRQNSEIQELQLTKTQYQRLAFIVLALFLFALLVLLAFFYSAKQREFLKQKETEQKIVELNKNLEKRMIAEIKKQEKQQLLLAQKSKLESLGTLAAGIAHEINQPLGGISMGLDNILIKLSEKNFSENYMKEKVNLIFENVERIKKIIDHTRSFSRAHKQASFDRIDLNEVVKSSLAMVESQFKKDGIEIIVNLCEGIEPIIADKFKLEQVVLNFLSNAKYAVDEKEHKAQINAIKYQKKIEISTLHDHSNVYFKVKDNGIGIKQEDLEKIFDPFFTTKKEDRGTGLGLSISYGFIKDLMGEIRVDSIEGEFSLFDVMIPKF
jgi:signal transduction histidine kinase